jgi:hypothetical protein
MAIPPSIQPALWNAAAERVLRSGVSHVASFYRPGQEPPSPPSPPPPPAPPGPRHPLASATRRTRENWPTPGPRKATKSPGTPIQKPSHASALGPFPERFSESLEFARARARAPNAAAVDDEGRGGEGGGGEGGCGQGDAMRRRGWHRAQNQPRRAAWRAACCCLGARANLGLGISGISPG